MKNKQFWIVIILVAALLIFKIFSREKTLNLPLPVSVENTSRIVPEPSGTLAQNSVAPISPTPIREDSSAQITLEAVSPTLEQVRKEAALNPHQTPPSILRFAADLGEKMKPALQSEAEAKKLLPELEKCSLDIPKSTYASTPQTLCFTDAAELAQKYPNLSQNFEDIKRSLDPDTLKRFNQFQKAMEKTDGTNTH